jgi:hypothetical protein
VEAYRCDEMGKATACVECVEGEVSDDRRTQMVLYFPKDARCALVRAVNASGAGAGCCCTGGG